MLRNEVISILRNLSCYKSNFMTLLYKTLPENIYFIINLRGENVSLLLLILKILIVIKVEIVS